MKAWKAIMSVCWEGKTMSKLLSANFMRLRKEKFVWIGLAFMLAAGIYFPVMRYMDMEQTGSINNIDNGFFSCALFIGVLMAVFCSLFIGTEYSDGTMRNKIIIGHKRTTLYFANLLTAAIVSVAMNMAFFLPYLCIGIPLLGFFWLDIKLILYFAFAVFMLSAAFSSIFTLIAMLFHNKAITAVICILLAFVLLFSGLILNRMLDEAETVGGYTMGASGDLAYGESPNPKYLDGTKRELVQTIYDINPGGQAIQCTSLEAVNIERLPIYSLIIVILTTGAGIIFFQKKDLK